MSHLWEEEKKKKNEKGRKDKGIEWKGRKEGRRNKKRKKDRKEEGIKAKKVFCWL